MIEVDVNLKHEAIMVLLSSSRLRHEEFLRLPLTDIDSKGMLVRVSYGKDNKFLKNAIGSQSDYNMLNDPLRKHTGGRGCSTLISF